MPAHMTSAALDSQSVFSYGPLVEFQNAEGSN